MKRADGYSEKDGEGSRGDEAGWQRRRNRVRGKENELKRGRENEIAKAASSERASERAQGDTRCASRDVATQVKEGTRNRESRREAAGWRRGPRFGEF